MQGFLLKSQGFPPDIRQPAGCSLGIERCSPAMLPCVWLLWKREGGRASSELVSIALLSQPGSLQAGGGMETDWMDALVVEELAAHLQRWQPW